MIQNKKIIFIIIGLILLAGFAFFYYQYFQEQPPIFSVKQEISEPQNPRLFSVIQSIEESELKIEAATTTKVPFGEVPTAKPAGLFKSAKPEDVVKPKNPGMFLNFPEETKSLPKIFRQSSLFRFQKFFSKSDSSKLRNQPAELLATLIPPPSTKKYNAYVWNKENGNWYGSYPQSISYNTLTGVDAFWDSKEEILALNENGVDAYVWNKENGNWSGPYKQPVQIKDWTGIDIKGDSKEEIVVLTKSGDKLYLLYDTTGKNGNWAWEGPYNIPAVFSTLTALNLDGDSKKELLALDEAHQNGYVWHPDTQQWTGPHPQPYKFRDWTGIDVQGDSKEEVAAIDETGRKVYVWDVQNQQWTGPYDIPEEFITWTGVDVFWDGKKDLVGLVETPTPRCALTFSPSTIKEGESSTAAWTYTGEITKAPSSCTGDLGSNPNHQTTSGSAVVYPKQSQTCAINVEGPGGKSSCSAGIMVELLPPPSVIEIPFGFLYDLFGYEEYYRDLGNKWIHHGRGIPWQTMQPKEDAVIDWTEPDSNINTVVRADLNVILTLFNPWGTEPIWSYDKCWPSTEGEGKIRKPTVKPPCQIDKHIDFYKSAAERYRSLANKINWELGNEPDGGIDCCAIPAGANPELYALYVRSVFRAIKSGCPECQIVLAGSAANPSSYKEKGDKIYDPFQGKEVIVKEDGYFIKVFKELETLEAMEGTNQWIKYLKTKYPDLPTFFLVKYAIIFSGDNYKKYFDMIDFHHYGNARGDYLKIQSDYFDIIRTKLNKFGYSKNLPIVLHETSTYSGKPIGMSPQTEKEQAIDLVRRHIFSLGLGIKKIIWTSLKEWHWNNNSDEYFSNVGIINNPENDGDDSKKLTYYTYKLMAEKLKGFTSIEKLADGQYKFSFKDKGPTWVLWHDGLGNKTITLNVGNIPTVKITKAVPKYNSGKEVKDYNTAFETRTAAVSNGQLTLTLDEKPVYVENAFETAESMQKSKTPVKTDSLQPQEQSKSKDANGAIKSLKNKIRFLFKEN